jgi:putative ABC transport system ATP-binding protein
MTAVLELVDAVKEYTGQPPVRAVDGVTLRVPAGDAMAIVGPSGSGKSTLLNLMGALDRPTSGSVFIDGVNVSTLNDRDLSALRGRALGFVFQRFMLLDALDAVDNVATALLYRGIRATERRERSVDALQRVGLGHRLTHRPSRLSGGEQQRVAIARAIVGDPSLILADEPTGNLDTKTGGEILEVLLSLNAVGNTVVVITHDLAVADRLPRRVHFQDSRITEDTASVHTTSAATS